MKSRVQHKHHHHNHHNHHHRESNGSNDRNKLDATNQKGKRSYCRGSNGRSSSSSDGKSNKFSPSKERFSLATAAKPPPKPLELLSPLERCCDVDGSKGKRKQKNNDSNNKIVLVNGNGNGIGQADRVAELSEAPSPSMSPRLPTDLLDRLANEILDHTKELGLFDEMRMRLLEGIERSKEFRRIKESFKLELEGFCSRADLGLPRAQLREKLNTRTLYRSARQLRDHVGQVSRKHRHELKKLYAQQANQYLKNLAAATATTTASGSQQTLQKHHQQRTQEPIINGLEAASLVVALESNINNNNDNNNNNNHINDNYKTSDNGKEL